METRESYNAGIAPNVRSETLRQFIDGWEPPTKDEIRVMLNYLSLTGSQAANIIGVNGRTIRKYTGGDRGMPYAAWRLLLLHGGLADLSEGSVDSRKEAAES